jgi:hypothetical protein
VYVTLCHDVRMHVDWGWVAAVLTLAGFLGSLVNALWARQERMAAAESAADAHAVQESMAASQASIAKSLARPAVAFEIVQDGRTWILRNKGQDAATSVRPEWPYWVRLMDEHNVPPYQLGPGEGVAFSITMPRFGERRKPSMLITCEELPGGVSVTVPTQRP